MKLLRKWLRNHAKQAWVTWSTKIPVGNPWIVPGIPRIHAHKVGVELAAVMICGSLSSLWNLVSGMMMKFGSTRCCSVKWAVCNYCCMIILGFNNLTCTQMCAARLWGGCTYILYRVFLFFLNPVSTRVVYVSVKQCFFCKVCYFSPTWKIPLAAPSDFSLLSCGIIFSRGKIRETTVVERRLVRLPGQVSRIPY